jgi:rhodanese-related sulfurtransferase
MKMVYSVVLALICVSGLALRAQDARSAQPSVAEVKKNVQDGTALLVDVRGQKEFTEGHLQSSSNLPISDVRAKQIPADFSKSKMTYLYCGCPEGKGAFDASKIMNAEGYNTIPLRSNYKELVSAGYEQAK